MKRSEVAALVTGAGGFIGHHLVRSLKDRGYWVRGADLKEPELDLRDPESCLTAATGMDEVYQLAADMGGIGFISGNHADIARNNVLINTHMLEAASRSGVHRYFYSSSACVYPLYRQTDPGTEGLRERDAYPAEPEEGYGWEKLFSERLAQYYREEGRLETRVARFHNIYGPLGTYDGGREKAPAAISRKIALAEDGGTVEVWGDGRQTRSFTFIDDCVEGIFRIMHANHPEPLNLGSTQLISIADLVRLTADIAGKRVKLVFDSSRPQGVRGRNSQNTLIREVLGWEPSTTIRAGVERTYAWVASQVAAKARPLG
jgi:nucleoside-diphosphate-sugar epimerase